MDADLMTLAKAHKVATWYDDWHREHREVSSESVIGVLALLGVDASTPAAVARALDEVSGESDARYRLPGSCGRRAHRVRRITAVPSVVTARQLGGDAEEGAAM